MPARIAGERENAAFSHSPVGHNLSECARKCPNVPECARMCHECAPECAFFVPANIKCCAHDMTCMAPEACKFIHSSIDEGVKTRSLFHPNVLENVRMCLNVPECATNVRSNELFRSGKYQVLRS